MFKVSASTVPGLTGSIFTAALCAGNAAWAQENGACVTAQLTDPPRIVFECANGLVIESEAATLLDIQTVSTGTPSETPGINNGAILVNLPTSSGPFQISTPHAIASVRGTIFVIDVSASETAVFVIEGVVDVQRNNSDDTVVLQEGDGVRVVKTIPGVIYQSQQPFAAKQWPEEAVTQLLARFGQ